MADTTSRMLDMIDGYTRNLRALIPAAKAHIAAELTMLDGYPTTTDNPKVSATAELTTVESAADQRLRLANTAVDYDDRVHTTMMVLQVLVADARRAVSTRVAIVVPRCTATGREGAIEWARPDCYDAPVRGPLCFNCYQRERRWREQAGLPARGDVA